MASPPAEVIEFSITDPAPLLGCMRQLAEDRNGWVNLQPVPPDEEIDERRGKAGLFALISGRGPALPIATWVPGEVNRKGPQPDSIGLQHGGGPKARFRLADAGVPVPPAWKMLSDHPKRGLVIELPAGTPPGEALDWLVSAATALADETLPQRWLAAVHYR